MTATTPFSFGLDYIRGHFGNNTALATQQAAQNLYRTNPMRMNDHILQCLDLDGTESVLDIGCGNGFVLRDIVSRLRLGGRAVAVDISPPMLELAKSNITVSFVPLDFVEGSAENLECAATGTFDRVMMNFLFHYIEDPDLVCAEAQRAMANNGRALVTIEARSSMRKMYELHFRGMEAAGFPSDFMERLPNGRRGAMVLENAESYLTRHFDVVQERPYDDMLSFDAADAYMQFYAVGHRYCGALAMAGDQLPTAMFDDLHQYVAQAVQAEIDRSGSFVLDKANSVFVCSNG